MPFQPPRCPFDDCSASVPGARFPWRRRGTFVRACDGRVVQRFLCLTCLRSFSTQSFRFDYRLRNPFLHKPVFGHLVSKVTHRQAARLLGVTRGAVALNKIDAVTPERLAQARTEVDALLAGTALAGCPVFPLSARNGDGVAELRAHLEAAAALPLPR